MDVRGADEADAIRDADRGVGMRDRALEARLRGLCSQTVAWLRLRVCGRGLRKPRSGLGISGLRERVRRRLPGRRRRARRLSVDRLLRIALRRVSIAVVRRLAEPLLRLPVGLLRLPVGLRGLRGVLLRLLVALRGLSVGWL